MDSLNLIMETQLTQKELIIFQLVHSGMSFYDLGKRLQVNHNEIKRIHDKATEKINKMAPGLFTTPVDKK